MAFGVPLTKSKLLLFLLFRLVFYYGMYASGTCNTLPTFADRGWHCRVTCIALLQAACAFDLYSLGRTEADTDAAENQMRISYLEAFVNERMQCYISASCISTGMKKAPQV